MNRFDQSVLLFIYSYSRMQVLQEGLQAGLLRNKDCLKLEYHKPSSETNLNSPSHHKHPPRFHISPELKKTLSPQANGVLSPRKGKESKLDNILFTIEENYYFRKNNNNISPRPPKSRLQTQRNCYYPEQDFSESSRQRKVIFTETLIADRPPQPRKQSASPRSIIRNGSFSKYNQDNLSNSTVSAKSISVQNSFVSQLKTSTIHRKQKPRVDSNKQKYSQIMSFFRGNEVSKVQARRSPNSFKELREKYTDTVFPPVYSSLFLLSKDRHSKSDIKWKRISDLFCGKNPILLAGKEPSIITSNVGYFNGAGQFLAIAFNALKYCQCILERIFEQQSYNDYGLYLLKIFQQNNWKSVIVDDFIPIILKNTQDKSVQIPYLINVKPQTDFIQIWPFLLLKAFANYYSAYQLMTYGNIIDFLSQLSGLAPLQVIVKKKSEKQLEKIRAKLATKDSFAIGEITDSRRFLIIRNAQRNGVSSLLYSEHPTFKEFDLNLQTFEGIGRYYVYNPRVFHTLSIATIGRYHPGLKIQERSEISLRRLVVQENCQCQISVQQKQSRFFCKSSLKYSYMWIRAIVVQREYDGYRWIEGNYTNNKSTVLSVSLSQGQYYLIIMPQWKKTNNHELTLLIWANHVISVEREKANSCEEMIEAACMDLAQRKGTMSQLKTSLCSYNYICPRTGLIIENINNEKLKQEVSIRRKISGIPCSVQLLPINKQFWDGKQKFKGEIQKNIAKLSAFTIVLKMRGGIDHKLVDLFKTDKDR